MVAVQGAFNHLVRPGARRAYADEYEQLPLIYPGVLPVDTSDRAIEEWIVTTGLGTLAVKPETEEVVMDTPLQVAKVKISHTSFGLGYEISHELMINDLYNAVADPSSRFLAQSQRDGEERTSHGIFNLAFTTVQAFDLVSLINIAHPLAGGGTLANRPTPEAALGVASLQASLERFQLLKNERGLRIAMPAATLFVPTQLQWRAREILGSQFKPFTANNEINPLFREGLTPKVSPFLTSATAWFVTAPKQRLRFFFLWRERPRLVDDFNTKRQIAEFMNFSIFSTAVIDWRGIDGSTGV